MKTSKLHKNFQKGQSLIEVIIALVVITIILTSLSKTIIYALKNIEFSRNKNYSLHLAQTKMEEIRHVRDSQSWGDFWDTYLIDLKEKTFPTESLKETGEESAEGIFKRVVSCFDRSSTDPGFEKTKMEVIVSVSWADSSSEHISSVSGYFTKWN